MQSLKNSFCDLEKGAITYNFKSNSKLFLKCFKQHKNNLPAVYFAAQHKCELYELVLSAYVSLIGNDFEPQWWWLGDLSFGFLRKYMDPYVEHE